jgi:hypothetical protein
MVTSPNALTEEQFMLLGNHGLLFTFEIREQFLLMFSNNINVAING